MTFHRIFFSFFAHYTWGPCTSAWKEKEWKVAWPYHQDNASIKTMTMTMAMNFIKERILRFKISCRQRENCNVFKLQIVTQWLSEAESTRNISYEKHLICQKRWTTLQRCQFVDYIFFWNFRIFIFHDNSAMDEPVRLMVE